MVRLAELKDLSRLAEINVYGWRNTYRGIVDDNFLFCELSVEKSINRLKERFNSQTDTSKLYLYEHHGFKPDGKTQIQEVLKALEMRYVKIV